MAVRRSVRTPLGGEPTTSVRLLAGLRARPTREDVSRFVSRIRGRHLLALDLIAMALGGYAALSFRYDEILPPNEFLPFAPFIAVVLAMVVAMGIRLDLYSRDWRFASVNDLIRIVVAVSLGIVVSAVVVYVSAYLDGMDWAARLPRSFWPIELLIGIAAVGGLRFGIRATAEWASHPGRTAHVDLRATLLYGAGRTGALIARSAQRQPSSGVVPIGFLDDDPSMYGSIVAGLRVLGGLDSLGRIVEETGARTVIITMPGASGRAIRRVVEAGMALGLEVRTVPSMNDVLDGSIDAFRARTVRVEDLLRRPISSHRSPAVHRIIEDQVVLITGAGGSIGSELARQVWTIGPKRLILVDRAESPLYLVQRELEARRTSHRQGELVVKLANVASRPAMERLLAEERPSVVFHAAAYKHVPMLEEHPSDAVHVNVGGTLVMLEAAEAAGVERFVLVSTDKAVHPTSVMGASKRVAEMLVADAAQRTGRAYVSVRFGNVLGSTGSVVPIFQEQLDKNRPLTVTHAEMTRFFMTIPEASWLILDAAALGRSGDLFVLDMGEPVRIMDLARDLIRLAGRDPDSQPVEIIGLRPGEKLHEELFYDAETVEPTSTEKVLRAAASPPAHNVRMAALRLLMMASGTRETEVRMALMDFANDGTFEVVDDLRQNESTSVPVMVGADAHRSADGITAGSAGPLAP